MTHTKITYRAFDLILGGLSLGILLFGLLWGAPAEAAVSAGYAEYYVPGDEDLLMTVLETIGAGTQNDGTGMHAVIGLTAWGPNTTIYYDHWEDGYDFDPNNPSTSDETYNLIATGEYLAFEDANIPVAPTARTMPANCNLGTFTPSSLPQPFLPTPAANCYYDGRDRLYTAGSVVTVTRAAWTEMAGTLMSPSWEVYPVRPQLNVYILPFGEDLGVTMPDFERVFAFIQATTLGNTIVQFDIDHDGTVGDLICTNVDRTTNTCITTGTQITLTQGEVFLLDQVVAQPTTSLLEKGTKIVANATVQVHYIAGDEGSNYEIRGASAFPRGFWDNEYYNPVKTDNGSDDPTNLYVHNPHAYPITISYETTAGSGSFPLDPGETGSFLQKTGNYVPQNSGVYLSGTDVFWGNVAIDTTDTTYDWGFGLVPAFLLASEHFMGWAPGYDFNVVPPYPADPDADGLFITPVQDNTTIFVDFGNDGAPDVTYTMNRLQSQYIADPDGDLSGAHIWATGPYALVYGENPDTAVTARPAMDLGYTTLPGVDFMSKVVTLDKTSDPVIVDTTALSTAQYSLVADTYSFALSGINMIDTLAAGWEYVDDSTVITLADQTAITGNAADPDITGSGTTLDPYVLTWDSAMLANMAPNQKITITFTARTMSGFAAGAYSRNLAEVSGSRTVGGVTQNFFATDFVFNTYNDPAVTNMTVTKTADVPTSQPLNPGDQYTYTVTVTNNTIAPTGANLTGIALYDPLPEGVTYVANSSRVNGRVFATLRDEFGAANYANTDGNVDWSSYSWIETDDGTGLPGAGDVQIIAGELRLSNDTTTGTFPTIERRADLSDPLVFPDAELRFDFHTSNNLENDDRIVVEVYNGSAYTVLETFIDDSSGSRSYNISAYRNADTRIRFRITSEYSGGTPGNEFFYVDNLEIRALSYVSKISMAGEPPNFIGSNDPYQIQPGQSLTLTYDVIVNDPLATGITTITNTAAVVTNEIPVPISASLTHHIVNPGAESAEVGDRVWLDLDGDGVLDVGEPGLANVEVVLKDQYGAPKATITTTGLGYYLFTGIEPGPGYYVEVTSATLPAGLSQSAPGGHSDHCTDPFDLAAGQTYEDADFGYTPPGVAMIGSLAWNDLNADQTQNAGEAGLAGITVELYEDINANGVYDAGTDTLVTTTTTGADGSYLFTDVPADGATSYVVRVDPAQAALSSYTRTTGSDVLSLYHLAAGAISLTNNFGYRDTTTTTWSITKTSDAVNPLNPGDRIPYTIALTNPIGATANLTGISISDPAPTGTTYVAGSLQVSHRTVADLFDSSSYTRNDGTHNWAGNWGDSQDGNAGAGYIRITGGELRLNNDATNEPTIRRTVDLTGATSALLTFDYRTTGVEADDSLFIEIRTGGVWTPLQQFDGAVGPDTFTAEIPSSTDAIGFAFVNNEYSGSTDYFYVDNLTIIYDVPWTDAIATPPNLIDITQEYVVLCPDQTLVLTYSVDVDDPLAVGIEQITNSASASRTGPTADTITADVTDPVVNPASVNAALRGQVWFDENGNAVNEPPAEPGLRNVTVTLYDSSGTSMGSVATDSDGYYVFADITPGSGYYVEVTTATLPAGLTQSAPSGQTNNRTTPFTLTAGQLTLAPDLGYTSTPAFATIGDVVWIDADNDRVRDAGELGLGGVTVQLWRDVDGDGVFEPTGDDAAQPGGFPWTTTTASDGTFLFTGVPATGTEDYFVYLDETQAALSGYTRTTSTNAQFVLNVNAGSVNLNADFGYQGTTYTIRDRVWFDHDGDANDDDAGTNDETGIANVTVDLLDASLNVIAASTTTDANGYFTFSGVPGNDADYTVRITDNYGVLTNYFGTTSAALARSLSIINLSGDRDYTAESTEPNFGYNLRGTVGDTVFNDLNGNGVQDSGETGLSDITVRLYQDVNTNGVLDVTDTILGTLLTNSAGQYLFAGLNDGHYIVSIDSPPAGYTYMTESPDNDPAAGHQQAVSIVGGSNVLTLDFGYQAADQRSASGRIWRDANLNGAIDGSETGLTGVTIELRQGASVITTTTTDSSGNYSFTGLPGGNYTVVVTDANSVLNGYAATYEFDGTLNGQITADLSSGNQTGLNFGFNNPPPEGPTYAVIGSFQAYLEQGHVVVEWETVNEVNTVGFYLQRLNPETGEFVMVNPELLPGLLTSPTGGTYRYRDVQATPHGTHTYRLVEVETTGDLRDYGPYEVSLDMLLFSSFAPQADRPYLMQARSASSSENARAQASLETQHQGQQVKRSRKGATVKIGVRETGAYYLSASQLAEAMGVTPQFLEQAIRSKSIALSNQGQPVAWLPDATNTGLYFYGEAIESLYTEDNIYWLELQKGLTMATINGRKPVPSETSGSFTEVCHFEEQRWAVTGSYSEPEVDFWHWEFLIANNEAHAAKIFEFSLDDVAKTSDRSSITLRLQGGTETVANPDHHILISLNGAFIGEDRWDGKRAWKKSLPFSQALLKEGTNVLEVRAILDVGIPYSVVYIDAFDVIYQKEFHAKANRLAFPGQDDLAVTIDRFTSPEILLLDVTDSRQPKEIKAFAVNAMADGYSISTDATKTGGRYVAIAAEAAKTPVSLLADIPSRLKDPANQAEYLIIAPLALLEAAQDLAAYRQSLGLQAMIVDLEDIYDEFNAGIASPVAIRDFLSYTACAWEVPPRYVVLAGEGTLDYKNYEGTGDNLLPPLMLAMSSYGGVISDSRLADVAGDDGIPEMAIGRIPVVTPQELTAYIAKVKAYEATPDAPWKYQILITSDNPDRDGDFPADSDAVAALLPSAYTSKSISLGNTAASVARKQLIQELNNGAGLLNYLGHGGSDRLAAEGLLRTTDLKLLTNQARLPVVTAMTCSVGQFAIPGTDSIAEMLTLQSNGGAIAVWAPTSTSLSEQALMLDQAFFRAAFVNGKHVLGDIILDALQTYGAQGGMPYMLGIYNLLGDPALRPWGGAYERPATRPAVSCEQWQDDIADVTPPLQFITIRKAGDGKGTIFAGTQACGPACTSLTVPYIPKGNVFLEAIPEPGSYFAGWQNLQGKTQQDVHFAPPQDVVIAIFKKRQ